LNQKDAFLNRKQHKNNSKDDFRTPEYLWDFINTTFHIEYDAACEKGINNLAPSLRLEDIWPSGSTIYSNPPYDKESIIKYVHKGWRHTFNHGTHIMLLPNKLCQVFMADLIVEFDHIIYLHGRVNFVGPNSVKGGASMNGSIIVIQSHLDYSNFPNSYKLSDLKRWYS
tara:strand:+ start:266 stop:772 length:507 start_codon:yes stop_codon:yes gene_type:complete